MYILFQGGTDSSISGDMETAGDSEFRAPQLLLELPSRPEVFFGNLTDLLRASFQRPLPTPLAIPPASFWPDVFVNRALPLAPFRQSALCHLLLIVLLWGSSQSWLVRSNVHPRDPFKGAKLVYYPVSEYLPPIYEPSDTLAAKVQRKGAPAYARQRIVSTPPHPDNAAQTIVTTSPEIIRQPLALPNIVAWEPQVAPPAPATHALQARLTAPRLPEVVEPPPVAIRAAWDAPKVAFPAAVPPSPAVAGSSSNFKEMMAPSPVAPPPEHTVAKMRALLSLVPAAVEPAPAINGVRPAGELNIARFEAKVAAPQLPQAEQRAIWIKSGQARTGVKSSSMAVNGGVLPPAWPLASGSGSAAVERIVALGLSPTAPAGPVAVPRGSRRGEFSAGPEGTLGAPGTPDFHGETAGVAGSQGGRGNESPLAGIAVAAGPVNPGPIAAVRPPAPPASSSTTASATPPKRQLVGFQAMRLSDIARQTHPALAPLPSAPKVEEGVFGAKKFYQMTLNMPNFTSSGGSWVVRFAELQPTPESGDLVPPVAMVKVDPAYPVEAQRQGLAGVVILYAVIHTDGTVGQIRVLRGIDDRLDATARAALARWRFRPGIKNGNAVELEAVIRIPFKPGARLP